MQGRTEDGSECEAYIDIRQVTKDGKPVGSLLGVKLKAGTKLDDISMSTENSEDVRKSENNRAG
jgi:hypothetical protein